MNTLDATTARSIAQSSIDDLSRWVRRIRREQTIIASGGFPKRMASKDSKHRAYGDAARIIRTLRLDVPRPASVDNLEHVLAAAARWTPEQYDAAQGQANIETASHIASGLVQSARVLRDAGFAKAATQVEAAAEGLRLSVSVR